MSAMLGFPRGFVARRVASSWDMCLKPLWTSKFMALRWDPVFLEGAAFQESLSSSHAWVG